MNKEYQKFIKQLPDLSQTTVPDLVAHCRRIIEPAAHNIYIACAYKDSKVSVMEARKLLCIAVSNELRGAHIKHYNPIGDTTKNTTELEPKSPEYTNWYDIDLSLLDNATHLLILDIPGIQNSLGVAVEIGFAKAKRIPIYTIPESLWSPLVGPITRSNIYNGDY